MSCGANLQKHFECLFEVVRLFFDAQHAVQKVKIAVQQRPRFVRVMAAAAAAIALYLPGLGPRFLGLEYVQSWPSARQMEHGWPWSHLLLRFWQRRQARLSLRRARISLVD
jgi:hypothetical protein